MTRESRHLMGAVAGLAALVPVYYLTEAGAKALRMGAAEGGPAPVGLACLAAVAVLVAVLSAWPAAAVTCGVPLFSAGALFAVDADAALGVAATLPWEGLAWDGLPSAELAEPPGTLAGLTGLYTLIGALLVLSALLPARWRSILSA
ncbi:hypothetical protein ETD86_16385 [Nonomuraea turkmeniaca]|uniref:Uncharacterized protein n=1 Tax=Nonomuraea turkmeniaca TaxID=103838 RepID=A0A5S4FKA2_9ACTN|nr:hypothetical protein [Nonomuraea turkmeniaca]TMR21158.1 hypothetical protein ETD86_16385 [Nonomuraea turkmeniaca]